MSFSLFFSIYEALQKRQQKLFDKHNKIISEGELKSLINENVSPRALKILSSAVIDHAPVEGVPYYLKYPFGLFYHDNFKKAFIADGIMRPKIIDDDEALKDSLRILRALVDPEKSVGYVQILAFNALAQAAQQRPQIIMTEKDVILRAFAGAVPGLVGALIFLHQTMLGPSRKETVAIVEEGKWLVRYRVQKALVNYFLFCHPQCKPIDGDKDIKYFLSSLKQNNIFTEQEYLHGFKEIGLFSGKKKLEFWDNTPHAAVGTRLRAVGAAYIGAAGAFARQALK